MRTLLSSAATLCLAGALLALLMLLEHTSPRGWEQAP